jgi:hypothetical protein
MLKLMSSSKDLVATRQLVTGSKKLPTGNYLVTGANIPSPKRTKTSKFGSSMIPLTGPRLLMFNHKSISGTDSYMIEKRMNTLLTNFSMILKKGMAVLTAYSFGPFIPISG